MSHRKSALLALLVLLVGTLTLAAPDGPCAKRCCTDAGMIYKDDQPVAEKQQVQLRVMLAEVERDKLHEFGFHLSPAKNEDGTVPSVDGLLKLSDETETPDGFKLGDRKNYSSGIMKSAAELRGFLRALKQEGKAKFICEPTLATYSGTAAKMIMGGEVPIITQGEQGTFMVEFREYGTNLEFLPSLLDGGVIRLESRFELTVLDYSRAKTVAGFANPEVNTTRFENVAELHSGESLVLAALIQKTDERPKARVPLVRELPLIKSLVSSTAPSSKLKELILVVNAELVETVKPNLQQGVTEAEGTGAAQPEIDGGMPHLILLGARSTGAQGEIRINQGRSRLLHSRSDISRTHVADPDVAELVQFSGKEIALTGLEHGATTVTIWCEGEKEPTTLLLQCACDPEADTDQPHEPAVLLLPSSSRAISSHPDKRPTIHDLEVKLAEATEEPRTIFGLGVNSDASILGRIVVNEPGKPRQVCREICCDDPEDAEKTCPGCGKRPVRILAAKSDECDDDDEDDDADDALESFVEQVLQAQMQYLETMMRERLQHEHELMEARVAAESALAKQRVEHAEEIMKLRTAHLGEIHKIKETMWESERVAMEARHRQAIEHEHKLAELQRKHDQEMQSHRMTALENELRNLRSQLGSAPQDSIAQTSAASPRQIPAVKVPSPIELPIHVEDLTSGRVRYSPTASGQADVIIQLKPHDGVERLEFSTPPISTGSSLHDEVERLRRDVGRLRALVEDLLCVTPESLPSPMPHTSADEIEDK